MRLVLACQAFLLHRASPPRPAASPACLPQLSSARRSLAEAQQSAEIERQRRGAAETTAGHLRSDLASAQDSLNTLEKVRGCAVCVCVYVCLAVWRGGLWM